MLLKPDDLLKYGGCYQGYSFMSRYYPNGVELVEIMKHKYMTDEFLHFGFDNFDTSDEEKALYYELLNIKCDNLPSIYHCRDIESCYLVSHSERVKNSQHIKHSTDIEGSEYIIYSDMVENSQFITNGEFVYDSNKVIVGKNITNSQNVVNSLYVVNSNSIINSENIVDSKWIRDSKGVEDCYFCSDCHDLKHAMFCDKAEGEYMLFNKPIDARQFELIKKQLLSLLRDYETYLMDEWSVEGLDWSAPKINRNFITQYAAVPKKLWNWLATLPGYDSFMLYRITFQPFLLDGEKK